jgi:hypothetical protein
MAASPRYLPPQPSTMTVSRCRFRFLADRRERMYGYQFVFGPQLLFRSRFNRSLDFDFRSGSMEERRANPRQRVFKAGTIEFDGSGVDCTIRNISPGGATLDVTSPIGIPHEITLNIASSHERQNCRIVWRTEKRIGVAFAH